MRPNNLLIEKKVTSFREQNGLNSNGAIHLKSLLIKLNVITIFKPLRNNFSGMAIKTDNFNFVLLNSNQTIGKQHFTLAHELFHLFAQENFSTMICNVGLFNSKNKIEYQADQFAALLLMPEEGILSLIPDEEFKKDNLKISTIVKIEQFFSVSRTALLIRLKELNLLSNEMLEYYKKDVTKSAIQLGYPPDLYMSGNEGLIIGDYGERAKRLFDSEKISESNYISLMGDLGVDIESNENFVNEQENN